MIPGGTLGGHVTDFRRPPQALDADHRMGEPIEPPGAGDCIRVRQGQGQGFGEIMPVRQFRVRGFGGQGLQ